MPRSFRASGVVLGARLVRPQTRHPPSAPVRGRCHNADVNGSVLELDLDFDAFSGPFDLLLALVLREELELVEVPIVTVVLAYLAEIEGAEEVDLESLSEFLVLVAALCELKSRLLVDADAEDEEELDAETAAEELALRLAEYQRFKRAAGWLGRAARRGRAARLPHDAGAVRSAAPAPLRSSTSSPARLAEAMLHLLEPPERVDTTTIRRRAVAMRPFVERFRLLVRARGGVRLRRRGRRPRARRAGGGLRRPARADQARRGAGRPVRSLRAHPRGA